MTPERAEKFWKVLKKKQKSLTIVMDNVHDPHNISACLRSCEAVGVQEVYIFNNVHPMEEVEKLGKRSSASAKKWLDIYFFDDIEQCLNEVRKKYDKIYTTHLSTDSVGLHSLDLTEKVALVFGNEKDGVGEKTLQLADGNFLIPQVGMIQSLNISVACAVSLYEALRQRTEAGMYDSPTLSEAKMQEIFTRWGEKTKRDF